MADAENLHGAAEKISGILNPKEDQQETEVKKTEPSESPETQAAESKPESEGTEAETTENTESTEGLLLHLMERQ